MFERYPYAYCYSIVTVALYGALSNQQVFDAN